MAGAMSDEIAVAGACADCGKFGEFFDLEPERCFDCAELAWESRTADEQWQEMDEHYGSREASQGAVDRMKVAVFTMLEQARAGLPVVAPRKIDKA